MSALATLVPLLVPVLPQCGEASLAVPDGYSWVRDLDWTVQPPAAAGSTAGNPDDDTLGNPVWTYEHVDGDALGMLSPWYRDPTPTPLVWDASWFGGEPGWVAADDEAAYISQRQLLHHYGTGPNGSGFTEVPLIRWRNTSDRTLETGITGSLTLTWTGENDIGGPATVDIVLGRRFASTGLDGLLFTFTLNKPTNVVGPAQSLTLPITIAPFDNAPDDEILITMRARTPDTAHRWIVMDDALSIDLTDGNLYPSFCFGTGEITPGCTPCGCDNEAPAGTFGGCLNSSGRPGLLEICGDASLTADTLRIELSGATPSTFAVLTSGLSRSPANPLNSCFGLDSGTPSAVFDGLRCVAIQTLRHGSRAVDANGDVGETTPGWGPPNGPPGGLLQQTGLAAGQTRHFQIAYREDASLVCGTGQNTTQGVSVTLLP